MKQYTTPEQSAKLIELGYFRPALSWKPPFGGRDEIIYNPFSIGELLSFLPESIKVNDLFFTLCIHSSVDYWIIEYADIAFGTQARVYKEELIDALYMMILKLKEAGVI